MRNVTRCCQKMWNPKISQSMFQLSSNKNKVGKTFCWKIFMFGLKPQLANWNYKTLEIWIRTPLIQPGLGYVCICTYIYLVICTENELACQISSGAGKKRWKEKGKGRQRGGRIDSQSEQEVNEICREAPEDRSPSPRDLQTLRLQSVRPQSLCWYGYRRCMRDQYLSSHSVMQAQNWNEWISTPSFCFCLKKNKRCQIEGQHTVWSEPAGPWF